METQLLHINPTLNQPLKMGDFDSCRFDFRLDTKSGLTPSRRKRAERKICNYNTLFKCKTCGSLFDNRPALIEHKTQHNDFRCIYCDFKFGKRKFLDDHLRSVHGTYVKIAPKPDISPPHEDDEIVMYPTSDSPGVLDEEDDEMIRVPIGSAKLNSASVGQSMDSSPTSPLNASSKILSPSLPPLVSVSSSIESASPPLPSSTLISQAVRNIFSSITAPTQQSVTYSRSSPSPAATASECSPDKPSKDNAKFEENVEEKSKDSPKVQTVDNNPPALVSPPPLLSPQQPLFVSQMPTFPQIRYNLPQPMLPMMPQTPEGSTAPQVTPVMTPAQPNVSSPASMPLPPGYVYINVPMYINPSQGNIAPQLLSAMPMQMPTVVPVGPQQPTAPQVETSPSESKPVADSTTAPIKESRRKRKRPAQIDLGNLSGPKLVIQDPKSLSSTEFEGIKLEPTPPEEIEALDFSRRQYPVKEDVNMSEANTIAKSPFSTSPEIDDTNRKLIDDMDFIDDRAAMLDEYKTSILDEQEDDDEDRLVMNTDLDVSKADADSTSQREDRGTPKDYSCDQCDFKAANGSLLAQHKTKSHKASVKTGLNKLLGKLWQHKMKNPDSDGGQENESDDKDHELDAKELIEENCITITPTSAEFIQTNEIKCNTGKANKLGSEYGVYTKFHTCKVCRQLFDNINDMWEHMGTHGELRKFKCNMCNFRAVCREKLSMHKMQEHPEYSKNPWNMPKKKEQVPNNNKSRSQQGPKTKAAVAKEAIKGETGKPKERYNCLYQCPEEGCIQTFLTVGGLKNHQVSHLEENCSTGSNDSTVFQCPYHRCGLTFADQSSLDAHQTSVHGASNKNIVCPLCKYECKHRSSMNWHMKSKHGLEKAKTTANRTVYVGEDGKVVSDNLVGENKEIPDTQENSLTPVPSPKEIQQRVEEAMHSMPDEHQRFVYNNIEGLGTPGVISYVNEPEEITIDPEGTPLTADRLALHDKIKQEEEGKIELPLDMSVKKENETDVRSETSHNSSSLDLSHYTGDVVRTLGSVPADAQNSRCSTPVSKECKLEIDSISTPTEDMQHFTSVLKLKYVGGATKEKKKGQPNTSSVDNFPCQICNEPFDDASKMWTHRLSKHQENIHVNCDTCQFSCGSKEELQNHMLSTHGKELGNFKAFICFICGKGYGTKAGLNHHMMRHSEQGPPNFPCPINDCTSVLHSRGSLKMHMRRQHGNNASNGNLRVIRCKFEGCGKTFNTTKHLKVHQMQHTGEMPLKCHLCDYACRQRNSMNWHMQSRHSLEKRVSEDGRHTYYV